MATQANTGRIADRNTTRAREAIEDVSEVTQEAASRVEDGFQRGAQGLLSYNRKLLEIAQDNMNTAFEYAQEILGTRSLTDVLSISTRYAHRQAAAIADQLSDVARSTQQLAGEMTPTGNVVSLFGQGR